MTLDAISGPPMAGESATLSQIIGFVPYGKAEEEEEEGLRHLFLERANDKLFYGRGVVSFILDLCLFLPLFILLVYCLFVDLYVV